MPDLLSSRQRKNEGDGLGFRKREAMPWTGVFFLRVCFEKVVGWIERFILKF